MENFALIIFSIVAGYGLKKLKIFPKEAPNILNQFVIYISLPAMIFLQIPKLEFSANMLIPAIMPWVVMGFSALLIIFLNRILNFSKEVVGSLLLVAVLGNSSFLGIPIVKAYFGEDALPYVLVYDQLGTFLALATYGTFIVSIYSATDRVHFRVILKKVITFPPFLSLIFSLFLIGQTYHPIVENILSELSSTIVPIALVAVGLQLKLKLPKQDLKPFSFALGVKLFIAPLFVFSICYLFSWNSEIAKVTILESAMAPMITAGAVASMSGLAPRLTSAIVGYGILFSFLTTNLVYNLIS